MANKKNTLRFIWERERDEVDKVISKIDSLPDDAINDIFKTSNRGGVKKRSKNILRFF